MEPSSLSTEQCVGLLSERQEQVLMQAGVHEHLSDVEFVRLQNDLTWLYVDLLKSLPL